jgi:hypothetical protein
VGLQTNKLVAVGISSWNDLWREAAGERAESQNIFGQRLTENGFERHRSGGIWYRGVCLRVGR